jgi:rhamnose transport system permease protein
VSFFWVQIVTGALLIVSVLGPNIVARVKEARARGPRREEEEEEA